MCGKESVIIVRCFRRSVLLLATAVFLVSLQGCALTSQQASTSDVSAQAATQTAPSPEQLLASAVSVNDFRMEKIPGDWSDSGPSWCINKPEPGKMNCIASNFLGWPAGDRISAYSAVNIFSDASTAASAFSTRLDGDKSDFGEVTTGPALGDESRYHARPAKGNDMAITMVLFRHGRYLVRVEAEAATQPLEQKALVRLAERVITRIDQLDAGTLLAPVLPPLAKALPDADNSMATFVTAAGPSDWWVYEEGKSIPSESLRQVLHRGVGKEQGVARIYKLKEIPGHTAMVTIMPFRNENAAKDYLQASYPSEPRGAEIIVRPAGVGSQSPSNWRLTHRMGRHVVEIDCFADDVAISPSCEPMIRKMDDQVKAKLGL